MSIGVALLLAILVLLGNAFFVAAEFALVSTRRSNIELVALNGSRAAKVTLLAMEQVSLMLAGAQLGVTLCSLLFGALGEPLVAHALHGPFQASGLADSLVEPSSFVIALILMVYLHVVIGEMVPKNLSLASSTRSALLLVPPLFYLVKITRPLVKLLNAIANRCVRLLGIKPRQEIRSSFSRDEVAGFVKESHREGLLSSEEEHLLSGTLNFDERTTKHIVLPLASIVFATSSPTATEIEALSAETGYSRFPVKNSRGKLRGYVHLKDILHLTDKQYAEPLPARFIRPLSIIKQNTPLRTALTTMQKDGAHIGQVIGRGGKISGLVMLEDVLEELVGPIRDETQKR